MISIFLYVDWSRPLLLGSARLGGRLGSARLGPARHMKAACLVGEFPCPHHFALLAGGRGDKETYALYGGRELGIDSDTSDGRLFTLGPLRGGWAQWPNSL